VHNKSFVSPKPNRNSGLHTVNEEGYYRQRDSFQQDDYQRKQRSSVAHFNNFPIGKTLDDNPNQLSRADVLAETEAKLNGQKLPSPHYRSPFDHEQRQNRRLSEPSGSRVYQQYQQKTEEQRPLFSNNKRMSYQVTSTNTRHADDKRLSLSRLNFMETDNKRSSRDWRSKSPTSSGTTTPVLSSSSTSSSSRPNSTVGLMNYHRLSTGSLMDSGHQRKPLFTSHLPFSSVVPHLKSNLLVSGLLRVNKRNRSDAYVFCEELNADIYICGSRDRNRALEGDHVAVKLIEVEQVMLEKHEKEEAKLARNNGNPVIRKPDEEDEKEIIFGGEEDVDSVTPRFCGVVVAILDRAQKQVFSG
jgi:protein SSD1